MPLVAWVTIVIATVIIAAAALGLLRVILPRLDDRRGRVLKIAVEREA